MRDKQLHCCVCGKPLDGIKGPSRKTTRNNDVIRVCGPNIKHFIHRGCAIRWRNKPAINILTQMGTANRKNRNQCPTCFVETLTNLETAPKVSTNEILWLGKQKTKKNNRKKTRKQK